MLIDKKDRPYTILALKIVGDFGLAIAVPVVVFVLIGQFLDEQRESAPLYTILSFVLAALLYGRMIYKKAKFYGREYQGLNNQTGRDRKVEQTKEETKSKL